MNYRDSLTPRKFREEAARATDDGFEIIVSDGTLLLLDLDDDAALSEYERRRDILLRSIPEVIIGETSRWCSKSGKGWHVIVALNGKVGPARRIALQAALGSDWLRESLSIARLLNGIDEPSRLFKPKL